MRTLVWSPAFVRAFKRAVRRRPDLRARVERTLKQSAQHDPDVSPTQIRGDLIEGVIRPVLGDWADERTEYLINPSGRFVIGGPVGDTGMTGRKIEVDTYGGYGSHGGGCLSGKDPTKVDRSGSYMARYVANNLIAAGLASECEVQIAYAIGRPHPIAVTIDTFGTGALSNGDIEALVREHFDFRPAAIIEQLDLRRPLYQALAAYGHFGRSDLDLPWERTDKAELLGTQAGVPDKLKS